MALVLTMAMLCSGIVFAQGETELLISQNPSSEAAAPEMSPEEINKNATGFTDVAPEASYTAAIKKLVDYGIIAGYPDGTFKPYGEVTRAEMCKMINLALGYIEFDGAAGFPDVTQNNWYYAYALAAQKQGYVEGYEDKTFRGSNNITRQEMCAILNRLLKPMNLGIPVTISDQVSNWARPHVEVIVQNYIMPLEENNTFRATENLKRHELATVLSNMAIGPVKQIDANVRFFVNGEQYGETQTVAVGNSAQVPADPPVPSEDYVFEGWKKIGTDGLIDVNTVIVIADVDYEAVFSQKMHNVTFYSRGAVYDTRKVVNGGIVSAPGNPEAKGYDFLGWALSEGGEVVKLSSIKIASDTAFYAVFEKQESSGGGGGGGPVETTYKVRFFVNGDLYETQKLSKNASPKNPKDPVREGFVFLGWSLEQDGEIIVPSSMKITKDVDLYGVFEEPEEEPLIFTVTFYVDGQKYDSQFVQNGSTVSSVSNPEKDGYVFKHWSKTEGGTAVLLGYYTVTSNTDFYAVFEKEEEEINYFKVTFMVDGKEYSSSKIQEGNKASAPEAPKKDGYNFKHWSKSEGGSASSVSVTVTSDLTFYAVFEKIEYTVIFYVDGSEYDKQTIALNETVSLPTNPSKDGYSFLGWSEKEGGEIVENLGAVAITSKKNYYAVFEKDEEQGGGGQGEQVTKFTINFIVDGKTYSTQEVLKDGLIAVPADPQKVDYNFLGWSEKEGGKVTSIASKATANANYYAVFEQILKYNVTFYVDGKIYSQSIVVENETASAPTVSTEAIEGYNFLGWSLTDGGEKVNVGSVNITSDTSFYAILEEKEPEKVYKNVVFKVDGRNYDSQTVEVGAYANVPSPDPEKEKYTFEGWSLTAGGAVVDVSSIAINADTTFHAIFKKNPVYYDVVFLVDGEEHDKQRVLEGEYPELPEDPSLEGYDFLGWSKSMGGQTLNPETIAVTDNTTYFAVFEEAEEEIVYYKVLFWFDGEVYMTLQDVAEGDTVDAPETPSLESGRLFLGWSLDDTNDKDEIIEVSDIIIEQDTDFYSVIIDNPNSEEFMTMLNKGYDELSSIKRYPGPSSLPKETLILITECIGYVLEDANNGIFVDKSYVKKHPVYGGMVDDVKANINEKMSDDDQSNFVNFITSPRNISEDVQTFLIDYFDIDTSKYQG